MKRLEQLNHSIVHDCADAIIAKNLAGTIVSWNRAAERLFGHTEAETVGHSIMMLVPPAHQNEEQEILARVTRGEQVRDMHATRLHKSGHFLDVTLTISPLHDASGLVIGSSMIVRPALKNSVALPTLLQSALYDPLTRTANRTLLIDRLGQAMRHGDRAACFGGVLFLDLDGFKTVNDTAGHRTGDQLLQACAERLRTHTRGSDTVARWGGDEFVVLLPELHASWAIALEQLHHVASKLLLTLRTAYAINQTMYSCPASIGGCLFSGSRQSADAIIEQADQAMYSAKHSGKNTLHIHSKSNVGHAAERILSEAV